MGDLEVLRFLYQRVLWLAPQTEWLQSHIPGRGASWGDVLADVLGLALGVGSALVRRRRNQRLS